MTSGDESRPVTEEELHAHADGLLPDGRRAAVEQYLAAHPEEAARVEGWMRITASLHDTFDEVLDEPVPARLSGLRPPSRLWPRLAAAAALLLAGLAGWWLRGALPGGDAYREAMLPHRAAVAHAVYSPEVRHPVEVGSDQEAHLVAWLSKRLGTTLRVPRLGPLGYDLLGGRLLPGDRGPVAQFMYADPAGKRLTLYVARAESGETGTAFRFSQEGAVGVFYWVDRSMGYALSAELPRAELLRVADAVYAQIEKVPG
ncbi:MAG: anti-sigma factor [Deltaproteobacteria bacterium]|nr:anti-sigma factor [Deltaproteobacteria bacterium]